jgi:hypothetical protein
MVGEGVSGQVQAQDDRNQRDRGSVKYTLAFAKP